MTIRAKLILVFILVVGFSGANLFVYFWSKTQSDKSLEELGKATEVQGQLGQIQRELDDLRKQNAIMGQFVSGTEDSALHPDEIERFDTQTESVSDRIEKISVQIGSENTEALAAFVAKYEDLVKSWRRFYLYFGRDHMRALTEMAVTSEPLAMEVMQVYMPDLIKQEKLRNERARKNYYAVSATTSKISTSMFAGSTIFLMIVLLWFSRDLVKRLGNLRSGAEKIGTGNLEHRLADTSKDELGDLAGSFNDMCSHLLEARTARKQAEQVIAQKSLELSEANNSLKGLNENLSQRVAEATEDIQNKNLLLTSKVNEMGALNEVANAINSVMELDPLLDKILEVVATVVDAEAGTFFIHDKDTGELIFRAARGQVGEQLKEQRIAPGVGIAGFVAQHRKSLRINDPYNDARFNRAFDDASGFKTRSVLTVPTMVKDELVGVLQVLNKRGSDSFNELDQNLFETFAQSVGIAWTNAQLFEQTRQMADDLRKALEAERHLSIEKEKMGAYIPKNVVDEISRNREQKLALGGKTVVATVLFLDLVGFTRVSENFAPEELIQRLNQFMTQMANIIEEHGGVLDKFLGDGIMAIFTPIDEHDNHALRAVETGIGMQQAMRELRASWNLESGLLSGLQMRVGINTGEVIAGNIGSEVRMDYTVIGDNVNVASRIEGICTPGGVFVSEETFADIGGKVLAERMAPVKVKNRDKPVQTFSIAIGDA